MSQDAPQPDAMLDAYLDGRLTDVQRQMFEQRLASDSSLRRELRLQQSIDASLQRLYAPPAPQALPSQSALSRNGHAARAGDRPRRRRAASHAVPLGARFQALATMELRGWQVAAAAVLLVAVGVFGWQWWNAPPQRPGAYSGRGGAGYAVGPQQSPHGFYVSQVKAGFDPAWECPPELFARITYQRFGAALSYDLPGDGQGDGRSAGEAAASARMLGAAYAHLFSRDTVAMLARVAGEPVLVLVDRADAKGAASADASAIVPAESGLSAHRRVIGPLVLYEITPFDEPYMLGLFHEAPAPDPPPAHCTTPTH